MSQKTMDAPLTAAAPDRERQALEEFSAILRQKPDDTPRVERALTHLGRLVNLEAGQNVCVIGCGPVPQVVSILRDKGFNTVGIEPVPLFVKAAREYVGSDAAVLQGAAESIPLPDESQHLVFFENVIEHVESPLKSLQEIYRILAPGGITLVTTTNRYAFSLTGRNDEYNVPYFNWFPKLVQESYVYKHLHEDPSLANFTERPAVHWFTYGDLCNWGRLAGFAQFYCPYLDLRVPSEHSVSRNPLKRWALTSPRLVKLLRTNPWLRALALTQMGCDIVMWKRPRESYDTDGQLRTPA